MPPMTLKAHFDGQALQLDEPAELPRDVPLSVTVFSPVASEADAETEPLSEARRAEIEAWIQNAETLAAKVEADDGPRLQLAVQEIRRQARELARRRVETSP